MTDEREDLTTDELVDLVERVFAPRGSDRGMGILVDLPGGGRADRPEWRERRRMAADWRDRLAGESERLGFPVRLIQYANVGGNNADLPARCWICPPGECPPDLGDGLPEADAVPMEDALAAHDLLMAPTELSATAPLKVAARRHGFRAATMPGFSRRMIPALRLDYREVDRRCRHLKQLLDRAERAELAFRVDRSGPAAGAGEGGGGCCRLTLDLRHREAHASGGLLHEPGTAGNLPSGETYVVPYEGEREGDPSFTAGRLPAQLPPEERGEDGPEDDGLVVYRIERNRAVGVEGEGSTAAAEAERLRREPAYGNLAELGLGVLAAFGIEPIGSVLLDEKLGLHLAFGRSDHFGGAVGPDDFTAPAEVVHIDRVYLSELQPRVTVDRVDLVMGDGGVVELMRGGEYVA